MVVSEIKKKLRIFYGVSFFLLFVTELLIALFVRDSFIRPYVGDMLVVVVIYTFLKIFFTEKPRILPLYVFLFAENCILLICGEEYLNAANTLRILMICIAPLILTNLFGNQILIPSGNEKRYSQSVFVGLWINLTFNVILIPYLGAFGAAIGTLITEIWNVIWMASGTGMYAKTIVKRVKFAHYIIPLALASACACMLNLKIQSYPLLIELLITGSLYLAIYCGLLLITKEPIVQSQIKAVFSKLRVRLK